MKHFFISVLILLLTSCFGIAQTLKGRITNQSGEPIQYSTVYIQELKQGTTSNTTGYYEISLPAGNYTVIYQSLGYQPVYVDITLTGETIKNVILPLQYYSIPEVRITATGEDPAYGIMRKAIGLAPYYLNDVSYYKAEVYLKGNLVIGKIPKLLQKSMKIQSSGNQSQISAGSKPKNEQKLLKAGDSFLMESINEIEFTAPDKYLQRMISYNSTFPSQGNEISPMTFIQASFYQPVLADMAISPLAPNAFSHYNYKYLGASMQGNFTINKIQVIPKRKSQQLFEGTIYIIEDLWCLQSVDLTNENLFGKIRVQQIYIPVQDNIWMPVSHKFEINISIIGFKADAGYGSSVKYTEVRANTSLQKPAALAAASVSSKPEKIKPDSIVSKPQQKINKILEKDKLSNRDMMNLSRLMKKESSTAGDTGKKSLEIKDNTTRIVEKDANKRDSTYWARVRPIPLSDIEVKSLKISDSLRTVNSQSRQGNDSLPPVKNNEKSAAVRILREIALGHTWSDTTGFRFSWDGLVHLPNIKFNTVDGFDYGAGIVISKSWKTGSTLNFIPHALWAFSREKLNWEINTSYRFNKLKNRQIFLRGGATSKDINNTGGITSIQNTVNSLILKRNYLKLYESRYITLGFSTEVINGLTFEISGNYDDRRTLQNTTDFSIFSRSKSYTDNVPVNRYLAEGSNEINSLRNQRHADLLTRIVYTPAQRYMIKKGSKIPVSSDWPTFELTWQHGINEFSEIESGRREFDMFRFEVSKSRSIGAFGNFKWRLRTAGFLDNRSITFYDFFHINAQPLFLVNSSYEDAFMIPSFYSLSTPEFHVEAHLKYTSPYLLLKLLPVMSNTLMRENVSFSYLGSRFSKHYSEIGYSVSEIFLLGEFGIYAGFDDLKFRGVRLKAIIRLP